MEQTKGLLGLRTGGDWNLKETWVRGLVSSRNLRKDCKIYDRLYFLRQVLK